MNKWFGKIGFVDTVEIRKGVYKNQVVEKQFYGDVLRNSRRYENGQSVNDDVNISNQISILADSFAIDHIHAIKYIEFHGALWKVSSIDIQMPRLILTIGGVWNGETATTP